MIGDGKMELDAAPPLVEPAAAEDKEAWNRAVAANLSELQERLAQAEEALRRQAQIITAMSQQKSIQEMQLNTNTRAISLDLAIKARGPGDDGAATTATAEGFLVWLRAGVS